MDAVFWYLLHHYDFWLPELQPELEAKFEFRNHSTENILQMAEGVGFEPTWGGSPPSDFESAPLGLSGIPPGEDYMFRIRADLP